MAIARDGPKDLLRHDACIFPRQATEHSFYLRVGHDRAVGLLIKLAELRKMLG